METMDLSKNFPQEYVNKRIDKKMIFLSAVSLAVGCYLFSMPEFALGSNVDAFRFFAGCLCVILSLVLVMFKLHYRAYVETGSAVRKKSVPFHSDMFKALPRFLPEGASVPSFGGANDAGTVSMLVIWSKDGKFAMAQIFRYGSFVYEPMSEPYCLKGDSAEKFLQALKDYRLI